MGLRRTTIYKFNRSNLLLGGERVLVLSLALTCIVLIVALQTWPTTFLGLFLWFACMPMLRMMGNSDPSLTNVFSRYRHYQSYYPPHAPKIYKK